MKNSRGVAAVCSSFCSRASSPGVGGQSCSYARVRISPVVIPIVTGIIIIIAVKIVRIAVLITVAFFAVTVPASYPSAFARPSYD